MMSFRRILNLLLPPAIPLAWRRIRGEGQAALPEPHRPATHEVVAGPLRGRSLHVAAGMPAFRDMLNGVYDTYVFDALPKELAPGSVILDIGAHIGYHALSFAALYPTCRVIAFEPNPANMERAQRNLALSPDLTARIRMMEVALSDTAGTVAMSGSSNVEDQTSSGSYIDGASKPLEDAVYEKAGFHTFPVKARPLDQLAAEEGWPRVALMKIDVEGAEHLVLAGALDTLRRHHPLLLIEIHSVLCMLEVSDLLRALGYRIRVLHEDRASRCFIAAD